MEKENQEQNKQSTGYTIKDAIKIADELIEMGKDKKYNLGAFVHGLIFALEFTQYSYQIPQQQIAAIKRDCRNYFKEMEKKVPKK